MSLSLDRSLAQKVTYERFCDRLEYFRSESKSKQETESLPQFRFAMEEDNEDDYVHVVLDQA